ncbi:LOW QUALITY PROTEIN: PALM2-AKAP2 fusion protein-like [Mobula hypostoma]|uniref:LOW QUALITY PROTEIN: PALM2-AKAP2 fusion protein-like n=1 Tax=Mobula hypostoma TaxID=723540 RepID=UPI002FC34297
MIPVPYKIQPSWKRMDLALVLHPTAADGCGPAALMDSGHCGGVRLRVDRPSSPSGRRNPARCAFLSSAWLEKGEERTSRKPGSSENQVASVNEFESEQGTVTSEDPVLGELPVCETHLIGVPEADPECNKGCEKGDILTKNAKQFPAGTKYQVEEEATGECGLKEGNEIILSRDLRILSKTECSLGYEAPISMQEAERKAFSVENEDLVNKGGSAPSLKNGTNLLSPTLNPITQNGSSSSFSITPSEINYSDDAIIHAEKVAVIQCQDMGDQDAVMNGADSGHSAEEESTEGGARLTTIKKEANFVLRKYDAEKKTTKLFSDDEERKYQTVIITETAAIASLEKERREIIKNQAVRKSTTIAEKQVSIKPLELEEKPSLDVSTEKHEESQLQMSTENANSVSFHNGSPISEPEGINTEQINFTAARQQFLQMERSRQEVPTCPMPSAQSHRVLSQCSTPSESTQPLQYKDGITLDTSPAIMVKAVRVDSVHEDEKDDDQSPKSPVSSLFTAEKIAGLEDNDSEKIDSMQQNLLACSSVEDLDSGLEEMSNDYNYGCTSDCAASNEMLNLEADNSCVFECSEQKVKAETPIEKEIRLALEREEILRKERGIRKSVSSEKMVQIKTKPLLSQLPPTSPFSKHKDKNRMVFFVQREIEMDSKREEKLKEEGKVKGLYDKGIPQEVEERKKVFEQQTDDVPVVPQLGWQSKLASSASQDFLDVHAVPEESNAVQTDSPECKELVQEDSENQPYTLRPWKHQTSFLIEQEIEEVQRREEELRSQRLRKQSAGSLPSTSTSVSESESSLVHPEWTSRAGALNEDQSKDLPVTHSQEGRNLKPPGKKDESSYAGIEPSDDVNTEVLESTRVTRRKSVMAQRWEAGIFNNHQDE